MCFAGGGESGLVRGAERRGGGVRGGVSPPCEKRWRESLSDSRHHPVGRAPRTERTSPIRLGCRRRPCGVLFPRAVRFAL